jgi:glycosyltransferase involved in cell wall biosynthesis
MCQVSFVIIAFNESNGIQKCIESIFKQKTKLDYEVILIDDGSTDLTAEIVKRKFGSTVQVYSQQNVGRGQSRFNGIQIAKAPLIAMVDGDIVLPENWLETCFANLGNLSAVGGTAVPDGDCSTIHRLLSLEAKIARGSISVTGNNSLIKKSALVQMDDTWVTPLGEDFRLNQLLYRNGHQISLIPNLVVEHIENKSYFASIKWLMASGIDATQLMFLFKRFRVPDLAFIVWLTALIHAVVSLINNTSTYGLALFLSTTFFISTFHFYSKFRFLKAPWRWLVGILLNTPLISSYLLGRFFGLFLMHLAGKNESRK